MKIYHSRHKFICFETNSSVRHEKFKDWFIVGEIMKGKRRQKYSCHTRNSSGRIRCKRFWNAEMDELGVRLVWEQFVWSFLFSLLVHYQTILLFDFLLSFLGGRIKCVNLPSKMVVRTNLWIRCVRTVSSISLVYAISKYEGGKWEGFMRGGWPKFHFLRIDMNSWNMNFQ